jgi:hypothetical protein
MQWLFSFPFVSVVAAQDHSAMPPGEVRLVLPGEPNHRKFPVFTRVTGKSPDGDRSFLCYAPSKARLPCSRNRHGDLNGKRPPQPAANRLMDCRRRSSFVPD